MAAHGSNPPYHGTASGQQLLGPRGSNASGGAMAAAAAPYAGGPAAGGAGGRGAGEQGGGGDHHGGGGDVPQNEPWLQPAAKQQRRVNLGLTWPQPAEFIQACEFISLGCYCGPSRALQALDVKKYSYPFDWIRSPAHGIMHVIDTKFQDFLTYTITQDQGIAGKLFGKTHWGGSFWHHDPQQEKTKAEFTRRAERLLGLREVPKTKPRVFCWAINSTRELDDALRLHTSLTRALHNQCRVYLCVLVDLQRHMGPLRIKGMPDVLFCRVSESLFADEGKHWSMEKECEAYAEAIAFGIRAWSGDERTQQYVQEVNSLKDICKQMDSFDGGSPALELFFPRRFHGQSMSIRRSAPRPSPSAPLTTALPVTPEPRPPPAERPAHHEDDDEWGPGRSPSFNQAKKLRDGVMDFAKEAKQRVRGLLGRGGQDDSPEGTPPPSPPHGGGLAPQPHHYRPPY